MTSQIPLVGLTAFLLLISIDIALVERVDSRMLDGNLAIFNLRDWRTRVWHVDVRCVGWHGEARLPPASRIGHCAGAFAPAPGSPVNGTTCLTALVPPIDVLRHGAGSGPGLTFLSARTPVYTGVGLARTGGQLSSCHSSTTASVFLVGLAGIEATKLLQAARVLEETFGLCPTLSLGESS